jgi:hypothetical protein
MLILEYSLNRQFQFFIYNLIKIAILFLLADIFLSKSVNTVLITITNMNFSSRQILLRLSFGVSHF